MEAKDAQSRIRQISEFEREMAALRQDGVLRLSPEDTRAVAAYHDDLRRRFSRDFDVDLSTSEHQLSWGMRITSTLGAIAFACAVFLFFEHYWDRFATLAQIVLVTLAPFLAWIVTEVVAKRYRTAYFTSLAALVAIACFVANLSILGNIYNITPTPNALLVWGLFSLFLAWRHDLQVVLGFALIWLIGFFGGALTHYSGFVWPQTHLPEFYLIGSLLCLAVPQIFRGAFARQSEAVFGVIGLLSLFCFLGNLLLSPASSLLPIPVITLEIVYTVLPFLIAALAVWWSIRRQLSGRTYLSATFLALYILFKYQDWFWDDWPHYLFFLLLGAISVVVIIILRRMRHLLRPVS